MRFVFLVAVEADTGAMALEARDQWKPLSYPKEAPVKHWPKWAEWLRQLSRPGDTGLGDVIARVIGDENSSAFKAWHLKVFDRECGCKGRQDWLNRNYPIP